MSTNTPRPYTEEEATCILMDKIWRCIEHWEMESRAPSPREKMEGLAYSILTILDGESLGMPGVQLNVQLTPHPSDEQYLKSQGENWFPQGMVLRTALHDAFLARDPNRKV